MKLQRQECDINFSSQEHDGNVRVKINAAQFERLAATFGFFNPDFLKSLDRAEQDYKHKRVKKLCSFKDLIKK